MPTKKTEPMVTEPMTEEKEDLVEIFIPRGQANDDPNFFVSVNGTNYIMPKGKKSKVPKIIADEITRSFEAQEALDRRIEAMLEASK